MFIFLTAAIIAAIIIFLTLHKGGREKAEISRLKNRYYEIAAMNKDMAQESLNRQIDSLSKKFPDKNYIWYLEKAVYDLEKDKK